MSDDRATYMPPEPQVIEDYVRAVCERAGTCDAEMLKGLKALVTIAATIKCRELNARKEHETQETTHQ